MNPKLELTEDAAPDVRKLLYAGLAAHNRKSVAAPEVRPLWVLMREGAQEPVIGGLMGATAWSHLRIEALYVPELLRGAGVGARIVEMAEGETIRRGCIGVWLDTYSFQARGFYERLGYSVLGEIADYPPGHTRYFMKKSFKQ
jgi:GNAT superfamily N-acetyltransferase